MAETALSGAVQGDNDLQHQLLKNDYASEWMGLEVLRLDDGHATIRMTLRKEMLNGFGMAHGGMIFAFGDTAFALACNPASPTPEEARTITVASGVDINFLQPSFKGQVITAVANRRAHTGRSGLYDVQIFAADPDAIAAGTAAPSPDDASGYGELIAEFRGRSRTISKK
ncbi:phenylacetic acid degradation protein [Arthrobacter sp. SW1]|uniref:hotdog fold thioesterase n=1 Tax=Arthrobacter sp. SW1 TaxID=1920889 RepID=UPI000877E1CD|nr:hotdog fold thioesterase [Arthrobacter sp. SW1]OFI37271.1 phenylacetic acid degradation protein [Arthrobacter sp. SW1]